MPFEVQNDKSVVEIPSPVEGTVEEVLVQEGTVSLDVTSTFPLDVDVKLAFLKGLSDKTKVDTHSPPVLTMPQAPKDSLRNHADSVNYLAKYPPLHILADDDARLGKNSFTFLTLTPDDARKLNEASFSAVDLKLNTAGNGTVAKEFKKSDKIVISVKADVTFLVDQDRLK